LKIQNVEFNSTIKSTQTTASIEKAQSINLMTLNTKITKIHFEPREKSRNYQYMFKIQEIFHDSYTSKKNANTDISEDKIVNDLKYIKKVLTKTVTSKILGAVCKKKEQKQENILALKHCIPLLRSSRIEAVNIDVECETMQNFIISHSNKLENLKSSFHKMIFRYNDPENDFYRNRVKGVISFLFSCLIPSYCLPLEIAAGAKLQHIVVDSDKTAKEILHKACLNRRVTLLPENKIIPRGYHETKKKLQILSQKQIKSTNTNLALNLVKFNDALILPMIYAFGDTVICHDTASARETALGQGKNEHIRSRAITLLGDDFNPNGTVTGGSRVSHESVLNKIHLSKQLKLELYMHLSSFKNVNLKFH
jgi:structural maintenance of chromosome 2